MSCFVTLGVGHGTEGQEARLSPRDRKSFVGWGFAPDTLGELTALPFPLAVLRGPTSKGRRREGKGREGGGQD